MCFMEEAAFGLVFKMMFVFRGVFFRIWFVGGVGDWGLFV